MSMGYMDAVYNMENGKRMIRLGWSGYYVVILPDQKFMWTVGNGSNSPQVNANIYIPSVEDVKATDWMVKI